ncbi:hypothetical protein GQ457_03G014250 [Hibiscus cannabinus]
MVGKTYYSWITKKLLKYRDGAGALLANGNNHGAVTLKMIWESVRDKRPHVPWHRLVWGSFSIPKHSFIVWLGILDRLPTKDSLSKMGIDNDGKCLLCDSGNESRNHIFLECPYSRGIWEVILRSCIVHRTLLNWDDEILWASETWKGKSLVVTILKIAWVVFIYVVWEERNWRCFRGTYRDNATVRDTVQLLVRNRLQGIGINVSDPVNIHICSV